MKKKIFEAIIFRGIGSISQLGIISYIGYMAGFSGVGEFSILYSCVFIASQIMKPGLEYFILSKVKLDSNEYNYLLIQKLIFKIVTPVFIISILITFIIGYVWEGVHYSDAIRILLSAYFISIMHLIAEVEKANGKMFWYALGKMAGINVSLLVYFFIKGTFLELTIESIDFVLVTSFVFLIVLKNFLNNKSNTKRLAKIVLPIDRDFVNYSVAGLLMSAITLGYPLILNSFINNHELGIIFSFQKFAAVLTILSSSVYTASTRSLISKRSELRSFARIVFKYYLVVLALCLFYICFGVAIVSYFDILSEVRKTINRGSLLVFIPEILIILTGPTMHVINILNDRSHSVGF